MKESTAIFKALSCPTRLKMVKLLLSNEPLTPREFLKEVDVSQTLLSHKLNNLKEYGVIEHVKDGNYYKYSIVKSVRIRNFLRLNGTTVML